MQDYSIQFPQSKGFNFCNDRVAGARVYPSDTLIYLQVRFVDTFQLYNWHSPMQPQPQLNSSWEWLPKSKLKIIYNRPAPDLGDAHV